MGSSSKAKSCKKKSSKIHSKPRKMKRSKKSGLYSDSDSMSSVSFSSSSSDSTYRGKKKVSLQRRKLKSREKRVLRRSSSSEDFSHTKKRKRSEKNADSKSWKKSRKDRSRRNVRHNSATRNSHDYSSCKEESGILNEESEVQRHMLKSRKNKRNNRESREERVGTKKRSHRSPSVSLYSRSRDQNYSGTQGDEIFVGEHKSRRLRSIIIPAEQAHEKEGKQSEKDSVKEKIFYDRGDYPSLRSNDSSSKGSKRHSPVASGDKSQKENVEGQETCVFRATEVTESSRKSNDSKVHDPFLNEVEMNKLDKESTYGSKQNANLVDDDLEAILRQQALENLKKFRGGIQRNVKATTDQVNNIDGDAKESFGTKAEIVHMVLPKPDNTDASDHVKILERCTGVKSSVIGVTYPHKDIADRGNSVTESGIAEQKTTHQPDGLALFDTSLKEDHMTTTQAAVIKSESQNLVFREKSLSMKLGLNQDRTLQLSTDQKLNENKESERKILPKATNSISSSITNSSKEGANNTSCQQSTSQGQVSNEQQTESKDGGQFKQKTMSVMRGGEMVQVNYKVYIPKRAPALSRRQLKR